MKQPIPRHIAEDASVADLIRQLTDQGAHLAQQEGALIRTEVQSSIDDLKMAVAGMAGAAVVGLAGLVIVLMGVAYLLWTVMALWLATMIVGIATLGAASMLYKSGAQKMSATDLTPTRTKRTLRRTPDAVTGKL